MKYFFPLFIFIVIISSCIPRTYDKVYLRNDTDDAFYLIIDFTHTGYDSSDYFDSYIFGKGHYHLVKFLPDSWAAHIGDSVYVYLASLDSLTKRFKYEELTPKVVTGDDLLVRMTAHRNVLITGDRTICFPASAKTGIITEYYNNYSPVMNND